MFGASANVRLTGWHDPHSGIEAVEAQIAVVPNVTATFLARAMDGQSVSEEVSPERQAAVAEEIAIAWLDALLSPGEALSSYTSVVPSSASPASSAAQVVQSEMQFLDANRGGNLTAPSTWLLGRAPSPAAIQAGSAGFVASIAGSNLASFAVPTGVFLVPFAAIMNSAGISSYGVGRAVPVNLGAIRAGTALDGLPPRDVLLSQGRSDMPTPHAIDSSSYVRANQEDLSGVWLDENGADISDVGVTWYGFSDSQGASLSYCVAVHAM